MKAKKKKIPVPRRRWVINPVTRVEESVKQYSRRRAKAEERKAINDEE